MSEDSVTSDTTAPCVRRHKQGWLAVGPGFRVWQEDEASARDWLAMLMNSAPGTPRRTDAPTPTPERSALAR